jgi:hypothetical protein
MLSLETPLALWQDGSDVIAVNALSGGNMRPREAPLYVCPPLAKPPEMAFKYAIILE